MYLRSAENGGAAARWRMRGGRRKERHFLLPLSMRPWYDPWASTSALRRCGRRMCGAAVENCKRGVGTGDVTIWRGGIYVKNNETLRRRLLWWTYARCAIVRG